MATTFIIVFFNLLSRQAVFASNRYSILPYESPQPIQSPSTPKPSIGILEDDWPKPSPMNADPPTPIEDPKLPYPAPSVSPGIPSSPYPDPRWKPIPLPTSTPPEPAIADPPTEFSQSPEPPLSIPYIEVVERIKALRVIDESPPQQQKEIKAEKGTSVYEVQGTKQEKVLGIIPITIAKTVIVSTSDGNIVSVRTSFLQKLLDFISF